MDSKRRLDPEGLWKLARVGSPVAIPGSPGVVVPVTTYSLEINEGRTRLWWAVEGAAPRPLTSPEVSSREPSVSPCGKRLAFVRAAKGEKPQLHVMPLDGGEPEKVSDLPLGCGDPRWLPDGSAVVVVAELLHAAPTVEGTRELLEARAKDPVKAYATEDRFYRHWDRWLTGGEVPHLILVDANTRAVRDLTPEQQGWFDLDEPSGQYDISPDGKEIAFCAQAAAPPYTRLNWDVFTVPVVGGPVNNLTAQNPHHDVRPRYSPDGKSLVYGMQTMHGFYADRVRLVRVDRASGKHTVLTEDWDRSAYGWEFSKATGQLLFFAEDCGRVAMFHLGLEPGTPGEILRGGHLSGLLPAQDGRVYFCEDRLDAPAEVKVCEAASATTHPVTAFNVEQVGKLEFGRTEERTFVGAEGLPVQMFLIFPPDFDPSKKWPLVHMIHGGPHGMFGDQFHYRWNPHVAAAEGYVVAMVNFHGSTSWGQEFARCIQGAWAKRPFADIMAATDLLVKEPWVDATRMAATGGSYGGYMVAWIAGHTDRFACLVNHAGVSDVQAQFASDHSEGREQALGGSLLKNIEVMDACNPARFASSFKSPMLVIHGERDYRVPYTLGLEIYSCYQSLGLPSRLVVFPDENHWVLKARNAQRWWAEYLGWLKRFLRPGESK